jgi:DNA-binding response OmpR family regulator
MTKILLCDDDASVLVTTAALLEDEGFELDVSASFAEAAALLRADAGRHDILILDQNLGDGLGSRLAQVAKELGSEAQVLLLSGDELDVPPGVDRVLRKGGSFDELHDLVRELIRSAGPSF